MHTGNPAPVVFDEVEFEVLKVYIKDLRFEISQNRFCTYVFPAFAKFNSQPDHHMGLPAAFQILQKFKTKSGKRISSRIVRGSKVTATREKNLPEATLNHIAKSMNHSRHTADKHYNYDSLQHSVNQTLGSSSISGNYITKWWN